MPRAAGHRVGVAVQADLGADRVLGYDATAQETGSFDVIVDTNGSGLERYRRRLSRNGRMVTAAHGAFAGRGTPGKHVIAITPEQG